MDKELIQQLIKNAVKLGRIEALQEMMPQTKWISRPQVLGVLKVNGMKPAVLKAWEAAGVLRSVQTGEGGTHKYRRSDVQKAMLTADVSHLMKEA